MKDFKKNWDTQHVKYAAAEWIDKPTLFAKEILSFFPKDGKVLDIGCGQGQDSRFFAEHGYGVVGVDLSSEGISYAEEKTPESLKEKVLFMQGDVSQSLSFDDASFDVVYSHLALHYFDKEMTKRIFDDIYRVLKPGGILVTLLNSVNDPEYGNGEKIEDDYFHIGNMYKRFFSKESVKEFANNFEIILADEEGETYKDRAVGNSHLVRFIAKKS